MQARVVCVPFGGQDRYYLTTLPRAIFTPHDVAELYRIRWEVELFFRGWRGAMSLDEVRRLSNPLSLEAIVLASLLAAVLAQQITTGLQQLADAEAAQRAAFSPERSTGATPAVRTFFAIALQLARTFPRLVDLAVGVAEGDPARLRRAARALADAVLDGARDSAGPARSCAR